MGQDIHVGKSNNTILHFDNVLFCIAARKVTARKQ